MLLKLAPTPLGPMSTKPAGVRLMGAEPLEYVGALAVSVTVPEFASPCANRANEVVWGLTCTVSDSAPASSSFLPSRSRDGSPLDTVTTTALAEGSDNVIVTSV